MTAAATILLTSPQQTREWGKTLGRLALPGDVIALIGGLGAGKTTLTQGIAAGMGVRDEVTSPTFTLIHEYRGRVPLFHMDPYRLERPEDIYDLGFDEYLQRGGVVVVEWADRLEGVLPDERLMLTLLNVAAEDARSIEAVAAGARYEQLLEAIAAAWKEAISGESEPLT